MKTTIATTTLFLALLSSPIFASTLVEIKSGNTISRIYSDGKLARMEVDDANGYTIIDPKAGAAYSVMDSERQVIKMSLTNPALDANSPIKVKVTKSGVGPKILGYKTTKYDFHVNDQFCGSIFSSKEAMKDAKIEPIYTFLQSLTAKAQALANQFNPNIDPCSQGGASLNEKVMQLGLSLKSVERDGSVSSQIIKIDQRAKLPKNVFTVPQGYQVQDMDQMHKSMQQELDKQGIDMKKMMRELQESGNLSPEMMEQMQQMHQQP